MSFLNDFLASMGKPARTGLLIGAVLVLLGAAGAIWWLLTPSYQLLFGDLRETDAAEITKSLADWKVPYRIVGGGAGIEVPSDQVYETRMKLVSAGVPSGGHVGFELFNDSDFGVTEFAQRVNYQRAVQGELERSIASVPGVEQVRVHLTIRRPGLFLAKDDTSKASVVITMAPGEVLTPQQVGGIRHLVASAVEGLSADAVVVVGPGGMLAGNVDEGSQGSLVAQNDEQDKYESRIRTRVGDLLGQVFHLDTYRVSVDARMNFDQVHEVNERLLAAGDGNGLLVHKRTSRSGATAGDGADKAEPQSQEELDYAHGTEREEISRAPGRVERLSVAVLVPPTLSPSQTERLRNLVAAAAGIDETRGDRLEIGALSADSEPAPAAGGSTTATDDAAQAIAAAPSAAVTEAPLSRNFLLLAGVLALGAALGWLVALAVRPGAARLRKDEREAALARVRGWLAEGGVE